MGNRIQRKRNVAMMERLAFVIVEVATIPLMLLWLAVPIFGGVLIGLPIAAVKFVITGRSGIDWYINGPLDWMLMNYPCILWEESMRRRGNSRGIQRKGD